MRFLKLCFVLMTMASGLHAQEKETCFYHVSFYKWEWNCCYGKDTIPSYDLQAKVFKDNIRMDTINRPRFFSFEMKHGTTFNHAHLLATSIDGKINYEVKSFDFVTNPADLFGGTLRCPGDSLNRKALKSINLAESGEHFRIEHIRIIAPGRQKEMVLPGVEIYIE